MSLFYFLFFLLYRKINCCTKLLHVHDSICNLTIINKNNQAMHFSLNFISKTKQNLINFSSKTFIYCDDINNLSKNIRYSNPIVFIDYSNNIYDTLKYMNENFKNKNIPAIILNTNITKLNYKKINYLSELEEKTLLFTINDFNNTIKNNFYSNEKIKASISLLVSFSCDVFVKRFSFLMIIFLFVLLIYYRKAYKNAVTQNSGLFVHCIVLFIIYMQLFLSIFFFIYMYKKYYLLKHYNFWIIMLKLIVFFNKSFCSITLALHLNILEIREHYKVIETGKLALIYFIFSYFILFNDSENNYFDNNYIFNLSSFLYFWLLFFLNIGIIIKQCKLKKIISYRIFSSIADQPLYISALKIKKQLLTNHIRGSILFNIIYLGLYTFVYKFLGSYRNKQIINLLIYYSDFIILIILAVNYFPRPIPDHYIEDIRFPHYDIPGELPQPELPPENYDAIYLLDNNENLIEHLKNKDKKKLINLIVIENPFCCNKYKKKKMINIDEPETNSESIILKIEDKKDEDINTNKIEKFDLKHIQIGYITDEKLKDEYNLKTEEELLNEEVDFFCL